MTYFLDRGYGFIRGEDERDYYVSQSYILDADFRYLERDEDVVFEPVKTLRGVQAHHVKRYIPDAEAQSAGKSWVAAKRNPFTPQDPVTDPMLFAGREEYVDIGLDAILNSQNILVTGERGVGKSSYSTQMLTIASGDFTLLDQLVIPNPEEDLDRLSVSYTCEPGDTLQVVAGSIAETIETEARSESPSKTSSTFGFNKIIQASHTVEYTEGTAPGIAGAFAESVARAVLSADGKFDGVCILVDEIDQLDTAVPLAPFLKAAIETLRLRGVSNVNFIVTGISGEVTDFLRQHASVARLFMNVHLDPMRERELKDVVVRALAGTDVNIHPKALDAIIAHSGCLPASVQLLGYYSYKANTDTHIDTHDVDKAIGVVVRQIRKQFYRDLRDSLAESGRDARTLLQALADYPSVNAALAADSANLGAEAAGAGLDKFVELGSVVVVDGQYRFRDPLFGEFLRSTPGGLWLA